MSYYELPEGDATRELGRKIYLQALSDRRGFRYDQLGIHDPEIWGEIFDHIGKVASPTPTDSGDGWLPIETAPKDGTVIWCYGEPAGEICGAYDENMQFPATYTDRTDYPGYNWVIPETDYAAMWMRPSHWMPLPAPPARKE